MQHTQQNLAPEVDERALFERFSRHGEVYQARLDDGAGGAGAGAGGTSGGGDEGGGGGAGPRGRMGLVRELSFFRHGGGRGSREHAQLFDGNCFKTPVS